MTKAEWAELSASRVVVPRSSLGEKLLGLAGWIVVCAFCLGMAGACYLGSTGMTGTSRAITLIGMTLFGLGALAAFSKGVLKLWPARAREIPAVVTDRSATWAVVELDVLEAWRIETGDEDVPTLLVRVAEGHYVSMAGQLLDDLWPDDEETAWESIGSIMRMESIGSTERVASKGPRVAIRMCELVEPWPKRGLPWWAQSFVELSAADLGPAWHAALAQAKPYRT